MREILFVTPTGDKNILKESVGPLLLATILRQKGIESHILSFSAFGDPEDFPAFFQRGIELICEKKPKILSFYTRSDCFHIMLKMAEILKERLGCTVVLGGPQADIVAKQTLAEIPWVDYICCGEGETTVYPLFSSILKGEPDLSVPGLVYRRGEEICVNPRPVLIEDLDSIPFLDYSIFPEDSFVDPLIAFPIDVGRGCPFGCAFCSTKTFWGRKYRLKSPQRIVRELQQAHDLFGARHYVFQHDMFTMNKKLVLETCRLIKELPFRATWSCSARLDCVDRELMDAMIDAGLLHIYFGIETGSVRMQKLVNKNLKLDGIVDMLSYIRSKNIRITASFIYGFPEETEEDISYTMDLAMKLIQMKHITVQMHRCAFLPGTALFEQYRQDLIPTTLRCDMTGDLGVEECSDFIEAHPELFMYFNEYNTPLRSRLQYFPLFLKVADMMRPVYMYYRERYSTEGQIQMYFDFLEANRQILEDDSLTDEEKRSAVIAKDGLRERMGKSPYDAKINEAYRQQSVRCDILSGRQTVPFTDFYSVSPRDLESCEGLEDCPENWCMVTWSKNDKGEVVMQIRGT